MNYIDYIFLFLGVTTPFFIYFYLKKLGPGTLRISLKNKDIQLFYSFREKIRDCFPDDALETDDKNLNDDLSLVDTLHHISQHLDDNDVSGAIPYIQHLRKHKPEYCPYPLRFMCYHLKGYEVVNMNTDCIFHILSVYEILLIDYLTIHILSQSFNLYIILMILSLKYSPHWHDLVPVDDLILAYLKLGFFAILIFETPLYGVFITFTNFFNLTDFLYQCWTNFNRKQQIRTLYLNFCIKMYSQFGIDIPITIALKIKSNDSKKYMINKFKISEIYNLNEHCLNTCNFNDAVSKIKNQNRFQTIFATEYSGLSFLATNFSVQNKNGESLIEKFNSVELAIINH